MTFFVSLIKCFALCKKKLSLDREKFSFCSTPPNNYYFPSVETGDAELGGVSCGWCWKDRRRRAEMTNALGNCMHLVVCGSPRSGSFLLLLHTTQDNDALPDEPSVEKSFSFYYQSQSSSWVFIGIMMIRLRLVWPILDSHAHRNQVY